MPCCATYGSSTRHKYDMLLCELRSNPDRNPRVGILDVLRQYRDRSDVFVTFTKLNKLGINPQSKYQTPLGIYAYPVKELYVKYLGSTYISKSAKNLTDYIPFAGDEPYATFFTCPGQPGLIDNFAQYTESDLDRDLATLADALTDHIPDAEKWIEESLNIATGMGKQRSKNDSPVGLLWFVTMRVAQHLGQARGDRTTIEKLAAPKIWNALFRRIGIIGFVDRAGKGIIHNNEPMQAVFFKTSDLKIIATHLNKHLDREGDADKEKWGKQIYYARKKVAEFEKTVNEWFFGEFLGRKVDPTKEEDFNWIVEKLYSIVGDETERWIVNYIAAVCPYRHDNLIATIIRLIHHRYSGLGSLSDALLMKSLKSS